MVVGVLWKIVQGSGAFSVKGDIRMKDQQARSGQQGVNRRQFLRGLAQAGAAAVVEHIPHAKIVLLPNVGHMITTPYEWMLPFLAE